MDEGCTRRRALQLLTLGVAGTAGCLGLGNDRPPVHDWPMFQYDSTRSGSNPDVSGPISAPRERWTAEIGSVWGSPIMKDGRVYVGSYDKKLHALDVRTGNTEWEYPTAEYIDTTPVVDDGTVYFGGFDRNIHAVDVDTGSREWIRKTGGYIRSSPTVVDDTLYIGGNCRILECVADHPIPEQKHGDVYALDPQTGAVRWHVTPEKGVISSPAVLGDTLFVASRDGVVHALDTATGETRWTYETIRLVVSTPAIGEDNVYIADWGGNVYAIDAGTGEERWAVSTKAQYISGSPAVHDGTVYIGVAAVPEKNPEGAEKPYEMRGEVLALSAHDGDRLWTFRTDAIEIGSSPAVTNDAVYVGSHSLDNDLPGWVYALDPGSGDVLWQLEVEGIGVGSSPAVVDGMLIFGDASGGVRALV